jgi:hypothetical protein
MNICKDARAGERLQRFIVLFFIELSTRKVEIVGWAGYRQLRRENQRAGLIPVFADLPEVPPLRFR